MALEPETPAVGDEIKPYKIHVSTKYLDLTRQKLELTRLPHEGSAPKSEDWWEPKPQVEPLIDFWLEKYSWRDQEKVLNETLPQFRTSVHISSFDAPLRIHFIHVRSPHTSAVPLLLIPPFPFCNLSLGHLVKPLTEPQDATTHQPFHLVIPSLPGLGFSDPLPNNTPIMFTCAEVLNTLMARLSYPHYLATNSGAASMSPAEIDWKLVNTLATHYPDSCLGTHFISPPLAAPKFSEAPLEWTKWSLANFFHAGILGYSDDDFVALQRTYQSWSTSSGGGRHKRPPTPQQFGLNKLGLREPNTLAYALCDSPTGLLVFVMKALRTLGPRTNFTPEQIVTLTELAWLPGPEYAMRFWAHCATHEEEDDKKEKDKTVKAFKPRVAITVFTGGKDYAPPPAEPATESAAGTQASDIELAALPPLLPADDKQRYVCPAWGNAHYSVVHTQRVDCKPGLLAWERPEVIAAGVSGLAKEILRLDKRLAPAAATTTTTTTTTQPPTEPLQSVVVIPASEPSNFNSNAEDGPGFSPSSPTPTTSPAKKQQPTSSPPVITTEEPPQADGYVRPALAKPSVSGETAVGQDSEEKVPNVKGKGKELEVPGFSGDPFSEGNSPDTLVSTPPLNKEGGASPLKTPSPLPTPSSPLGK
ncbi:epoxide hydrolase [Coniochaeta sp. 2T2.1]|nr:epoxide hydrolase [Coniochaeta sp. 2T2.1]